LSRLAFSLADLPGANNGQGQTSSQRDPQPLSNESVHTSSSHVEGKAPGEGHQTVDDLNLPFVNYIAPPDAGVKVFDAGNGFPRRPRLSFSRRF
jgi:hypothetical protein